MYNGKNIRELIARAGLTQKQFKELAFGGKKTDLHHVEMATSVTSNTLEKMRNALKCSMDDFFTVPDWATNGNSHVVGSNNVLSSVAIGGTSTEVQYLKELLQEKDKRIATLENYIRLMESKEK